MSRNHLIEDIFPVKVLLINEKRSMTVKVSMGATLMDVVHEAGQPLDGVLVLMGGKPVPMDKVIDRGSDDIEIGIINVASGG
jgi:sulfur carrier protein ThiS